MNTSDLAALRRLVDASNEEATNRLADIIRNVG